MTKPKAGAAEGPPPLKRWRRLGLRREVLILLPVAYLLLILLSLFTLFSYRGAIELLVEERRGDALALAEGIAGELGSAPERAGSDTLRRLAPGARSVRVLSAAGSVLAQSGTPAAPSAAIGASGGSAEAPPSATVHGPDDLVGDAVVAVVPLHAAENTGAAAPAAARGRVEVELAAPALGRQRRSLAILTAVVVTADLAVGLLVVLFLGHLLSPLETLLARAREVGEVPPADEDEVAFLLSTFERALAALAEPAKPAERPGDDIELLQRTLTASFESGVLLLDREGRVLAVNTTGGDLLGLGEIAAGTPVERALTAHPELARILTVAAAGGTGVRRREVATTLPGDRPLLLGVTVHPLRRDDGEPRGFLALFADLTEARRQTEQARLAESLEQVGELAAGVAHELRNGLATLKGYLLLVERGRAAGEDGPDGEAIGDYVGEMRREADHLQRVLDDFLSFARPGSTRMEEVDVYRLASRAGADPALAGARVELAPRPPEPCVTSGDPVLLERALRNLLGNAAEAGAVRGEPRIEVAVHAGRELLTVEIADRGPGLPDEIRERLFQPFTSGRPGGVGLGLALARRIVVLHGGALELVDRPGGGTIARLTLPRGEFVTKGNNSAAENRPPSDLLP